MMIPKQLTLILLLTVALVVLTRPFNSTAAEPTAFVSLTDAQLDALHAHDIPLLSHTEYGAFHWVELPTAALARLSGERPLKPADFTLHLGGRSFDPLTLPAADVSPTAEADFHLIQLIGPTKPLWLEQLAEAGLTPLQYIHPYTYVVWADGQAVSQMTARSAAWPFVRWHGRFDPAYRYPPEPLLAADDNNLSPQPFTALLYRPANDDTIQTQVEALGGTITPGIIINEQWQTADLRLPPEQLPATAAIPGIYTIQSALKNGGSRSEFSALINIGQHDGAFNPIPGYQTWLSDQNLSGTDVIIALVDEGIDETHPDLAARITSCTGTTCSTTSSLHGSHTAGIIAGDASSGQTDSFGFLRGLGVAPNATLIEQTFFDDQFILYNPLLLMSESVRNQAVISSNSWGPSSTPQGYDLDTMMIDSGVRDADAAAAGHQPLTYIVAIMNGFGGFQSQGSPDEAKNVISVGSSTVRRTNGIPYESINDVSSNSAHGPALDGRNLPLIIAPGFYVDSTAPDSSYQYLLGTSMAAPQVSGAAALFVDYYRQSFQREPSPALIKAALLAVTHDLIGQRDADGQIITERFDSTKGWGRLDLAAVVTPESEVRYYDTPTIFTSSGEKWRLALLPSDPTRPVKMMLVWTDAPGHGLGGSTPAWNNDLDLQLESDGSTYYANNFDAEGWSTAGGTADGHHNTEAIFLRPEQLNGRLQITITASNINSDGVPDNGEPLDQDFAFVCYNCQLVELTRQYSLPFIMVSK